MLKQLILENWKSFRHAELPLDPLTVLIGTNASGKSNVAEALELLKRIVRGEDIEVALEGSKTLSSIRGGVEWAAFKPETQFILKLLVQGENDSTDYLYGITIQTKPVVEVLDEYIIHQKYQPDKTNIYSSNYLFKQETNSHISSLRYLRNSLVHSIPTPSNLFSNQELINSGNIYLLNKVIYNLENILVINPIPSKMRNYSRLSDTLENDASNIAGVLAALPTKCKAEVESTLSAYINDLPEGDIKKVFAEPVGRLKTDAMLYCEEEWKPGEMTLIDAKTMSDGTLRFLAILTALLTRPEGSQIVIEEIDNGLHPSRAGLLVRILREIGQKRKIDILLTTHNPALLDALGPEIVPFVVVAHRDSETGESKLTLLEDIDNFSKLFASYSLGDMTTKGAIERSLSHNE